MALLPAGENVFLYVDVNLMVAGSLLHGFQLLAFLSFLRLFSLLTLQLSQLRLQHFDLVLNKLLLFLLLFRAAFAGREIFKLGCELSDLLGQAGNLRRDIIARGRAAAVSLYRWG